MADREEHGAAMPQAVLRSQQIDDLREASRIACEHASRRRLHGFSWRSAAVERRGAVLGYAAAVEDQTGLALLVGGHLNMVSFVMDYVEFRIDYHCLRALSPPRVILADRTTATFPEPGSRDALCRLIDSTVISAREVLEQSRPMRIELETDAGDVLDVDFSRDSGGPEAAHLVPADANGRLTTRGMSIWIAT